MNSAQSKAVAVNLPNWLQSTLALLLLLCAPAIAQTGPQSWATVVESASKALVLIETDKSLGSGFVARPDGTLITNNHVIEGGTSIAVRFPSGETYRGAVVLAVDRDHDLAVIRIDGIDCPTLPMANSNDARVGDPVLLMGAPRGLEQTATTGIVAGIRVDPNGVRLLQTSAPASPGSSGGPLLDSAGAAIGVLSFSFSNSQNLNFAIPINYVKAILDRLSAVRTEPVRQLLPLAAISSPKLDKVSPSEEVPAPKKLSGVYVNGFGPEGYLSRVYSELVEVLAQEGVPVVALDDVSAPRSIASLADMLSFSKGSGLSGVLYFKLSTGWGQTDRLELQSYDSNGKMLWREETTSRWQSSIDAAVNAVTRRMKDRLRARLKR